MKSLVEGECGGPNALVSTANRLAGRSSDGASQRLRPLPASAATAASSSALVREFLAPDPRATHTFAMGDLVQSLQPPKPLPTAKTSSLAPSPIGEEAERWAKDFGAQRQATPRHGLWAKEFLAQPSHGPRALAWQGARAEMGPAGQRGDDAHQWSAEFLSDAESSLDSLAEQRAEAWTKEFQRDRTQSTDEDFWRRLESEWMGARAADEGMEEWLGEYQNTTDKAYTFETENPFAATEAVEDLLGEGKACLERGELRRAVLLLEAAVQKAPESAEAWLALGQAQSENEQEPAAIAALNKALQIQPEMRAARFALATAFTNENLYNDAIACLAQWLAAHPDYGASLPANFASTKPSPTSFIDGEFFAGVEAAFLAAASQQRGSVDAELQNALGVLYNLSGNFERAVEALKAGLSVAPEDPRLWNRLGATLANSSRSAEAVAAYSKALSLYPGFVRARYNLGISCMNLRSSREAVEHFMAALSLQQRGMGPAGGAEGMSEAVWSTLRVALNNYAREGAGPNLINRDGLIGLVDSRDFGGLASALNIHSPPVPQVSNPNVGDITASVK